MKISLLLAALVAVGTVEATAQHRVFASLGGNGGLVSANYEYGLSPNLGLQAGAGTFLFFTAFPVTASYLQGGGPHYFEIGGGALLVPPQNDSDDDGFGGDWFSVDGQVAATGILGYRFMNDPGFMARIAFTPFLTQEGFGPFGGVSIGWAF